MTQFMKLLLVGTITGMVMTTAAIRTAAAAGPENRITILYDAFGDDLAASNFVQWPCNHCMCSLGEPIGRSQSRSHAGSRKARRAFEERSRKARIPGPIR